MVLCIYYVNYVKTVSYRCARPSRVSVTVSEAGVPDQLGQVFS